MRAQRGKARLRRSHSGSTSLSLSLGVCVLSPPPLPGALLEERGFGLEFLTAQGGLASAPAATLPAKSKFSLKPSFCPSTPGPPWDAGHTILDGEPCGAGLWVCFVRCCVCRA